MNAENIDILLKALDRHKVQDLNQLEELNILTPFENLDIAIYESLALGLIEVEKPRLDINGNSYTRGFTLTKEGHIAILKGSTLKYLKDQVESTSIQLSLSKKLNKTFWITFSIGIIGGVFGILSFFFDKKELIPKKQKQLNYTIKKIDTLEHVIEEGIIAVPKQATTKKDSINLQKLIH